MITPIQCTKYFRNDSIQWITAGNDTQYYIDQTLDGEVIIVFDKSNSKIDWKTNFNFWKKPYKNMEIKYYVHGGFLKCWKLIRDEIEAKVKALNPSSISITGWSYGGAIATLCMEDMWYCFPKLRNGRLNCITFGAPRTIGFLNRKKITERWEGTRLFKNSADIVTCVPFVSMFFKHVRPQVCIGDNIKWWRYFNPYKYHDISGYIESLNKIIK